MQNPQLIAFVAFLASSAPNSAASAQPLETPAPIDAPKTVAVKCDGPAGNSASLLSPEATSSVAITIDRGVCVIKASITLSQPITLLPGSIIKPNKGVTVTLNGHVTGSLSQHFDLSAGGAIRGAFGNPVIPVQWFDSGAGPDARRAALQAALDVAVSDKAERNVSVSLCGAGRNGIFDIGAHGVTVSGNDLPFIDGCQPIGQVTADSTNLVMAPTSSEPAITFLGNTSQCGCGVRGIFIEGNTNTTGIQLNNVVGANNNIGFSPNIGLAIHFLDTAGRFTEANRTVLNGGLSSKSILARFSNAGGTGSFAGNSFDVGTNVSTNAARLLPLIQVDRGAFWYNGVLNLNVHNNGGGPFYIINNQQSPPLYLAGGIVQLEGSSSASIGFANPANSRVYFGGTITAHAIRNADLSAVTFCRTFYYDSSINCRGGMAQQLTSSGKGNTTIPIPNLLGVPDGEYHITISTADNSYNYVATVPTFINSGVSGFFSLEAAGLIHDQQGYGPPTFSIAGSQLTARNSRWPANTVFTISYSETSH